MCRFVLLLFFLLLALPELLAGEAPAPLGAAPKYTSRELSPVPNAQAITQQIWIPGIDEGYVPQGLVFLDGVLFVSSYKSIDRNQSKGPCRLYMIDATSGGTLGQLDLPASCGHAGGVARALDGRIVVVDTDVLFVIEAAKPARPEIGRVIKTVKLSGAVKGSFATSTNEGIWIGAYERSGQPKLFGFAWSALEKPALTEKDASAFLPIPLLAQGAAFDSGGRLWVMRSGSAFGELVRMETNGETAARFAMPAGGENISFDTDGGLWTLSEAGSIRWSGWKTHYPLIFRFDTRLLQ